MMKRLRRECSNITDLSRLENEDSLAWQIRCCLAKRNKETDMDWVEIRDMLGLEITPDQLRKQAVGIELYHNYIHNNPMIDNRILSVSDTHYPFNKPLDIFSDYIGKVDTLQLNGDILDCYSISKYSKSYRISPIEEMIGARQYIIDLIEMIKPKRVVANYGNHEIRLGAFLAKNLDNELQELMPETAFDYIFTDGFTHYDRKTKAKVKYDPLVDVSENITFEYDGKWFSCIGDTIFCHPKTFSSAPLKTAEKALYWFRNEGYVFKNMIMSHTHRIGSYKIGNSNIYEQGACCDTTKMMYGDGQLVNSQKQGFIYLCQDKDGNTIDEFTKLVSLN